jgi:hypothetical protein
MYTRLFCINCKGRDPNTDSQKYHETGDYANSSIAHAFCFRRERARSSDGRSDHAARHQEQRYDH